MVVTLDLTMTCTVHALAKITCPHGPMLPGAPSPNFPKLQYYNLHDETLPSYGQQNALDLSVQLVIEDTK